MFLKQLSNRRKRIAAIAMILTEYFIWPIIPIKKHVWEIDVYFICTFLGGQLHENRLYSSFYFNNDTLKYAFVLLSRKKIYPQYLLLSYCIFYIDTFVLLQEHLLLSLVPFLKK